MDTELVGLTSLATADDGRTDEKVYCKQGGRRSKPRAEPGEEDDNDVRLISELTSANLGGHLMPEFKALTKLIRTKLKTDHQAARHPLESGRFSDLKIGSHKIAGDHRPSDRTADRMAARALANRITDERMINRTPVQRRSQLIQASWMVIILVSNFIADNRIYAKASSDGASGQQQPALFFTGNLPAKLAFYNTTGTVLNCPISGVPKPTIYWLAVGGHQSSLNALNGLNGLNGKASYRYSSSFNFVNQYWPIGGHYRNHYQQSTGNGNSPTANSNLLENVLASNPELSSVVDQHSVIYTRNDGALVFPPFYANDLQPNVHNRKYRCLAINEHGALLSNEIQIKACKYSLSRCYDARFVLLLFVSQVL